MTGRKVKIFAAAVLAGLIAGCSVDDRRRVDIDVPLRFDPVMYMTLKSAEGAGEFPRETDFGVSMATAAGPYLMPDTRVSWDDDGWKPVPDALWPPFSTPLGVIAYAPYGAADGVSMEEGVRFSVKDFSQTDLLYTAPISRLDKHRSPVVNLPFRHALCALDFKVRTNASMKVTLVRVALERLFVGGTFSSLPEAVWETSGDPLTVEFFSGEMELGHANAVAGSTCMVIPQTVRSKVLVTLEYDGSILPIESEVVSASLEPGRHYTLSLCFKPESMSVEVDIIEEMIG